LDSIGYDRHGNHDHSCETSCERLSFFHVQRHPPVVVVRPRQMDSSPLGLTLLSRRLRASSPALHTAHPGVRLAVRQHGMSRLTTFAVGDKSNRRQTETIRIPMHKVRSCFRAMVRNAISPTWLLSKPCPRYSFTRSSLHPATGSFLPRGILTGQSFAV
jgi:hypothetical protein